jgi:hypothetical protein
VQARRSTRRCRSRASASGRKVQLIGNPTVDNLVTIAWSAAGLATLDDVASKGGLFCGGTGGGPTTMYRRS